MCCKLKLFFVFFWWSSLTSTVVMDQTIDSLKLVSVEFKSWKESTSCQHLIIRYTKDFDLKINTTLSLHVYEVKDPSVNVDVSCFDDQGYCSYNDFEMIADYAYNFSFYLTDDSTGTTKLMDSMKRTFSTEDMKGPLTLTKRVFDKDYNTVEFSWYKPWRSECFISFVGFQLRCIPSDKMDRSCFKDNQTEFYFNANEQSCSPIPGNKSFSQCRYVLKGLSPSVSFYKMSLRYTTNFTFDKEPDPESPFSEYGWSDYSNVLYIRRNDDKEAPVNVTEAPETKKRDEINVKQIAIGIGGAISAGFVVVVIVVMLMKRMNKSNRNSNHVESTVTPRGYINEQCTLESSDMRCVSLNVELTTKKAIPV